MWAQPSDLSYPWCRPGHRFHEQASLRQEAGCFDLGQGWLSRTEAACPPPWARLQVTQALQASHTPVGSWKQAVLGLAPRALGEDRYEVSASRS